MNLSIRSSSKELLDRDDIPFDDIRQNLVELNFINTWLGGHTITVAGLKQLLGGRKSAIICEIGCGGGDNLFAIDGWCKKNGVTANLIGVDLKQECIDFAKKKQQDNCEWITSDYRSVSFNVKPDVIFSSLFCHHFSEDALVEQLQWIQQNSNLGFFINDLHRHKLAYLSIKILTAIFSSSYLVKNDAPLSVARGFKKEEWQALLSKAQIVGAKVLWKWAFRHLIVYRHE